MLATDTAASAGAGAGPAAPAAASTGTVEAEMTTADAAGEAAEATDIWQATLAEAFTQSSLVEATTVVVLGDQGSGKSSLVARLRAGESAEIETGEHGAAAVDYSFVNVTAADEEDNGAGPSTTRGVGVGEAEVVSRIGFWQFASEAHYQSLLPLAISSRRAAHTLVLITLDATQPWDAVASLTKWLGVVDSAASELLPPAKLAEQKNELQAVWQRYRDANRDATDSSVGAEGVTDTSPAPPTAMMTRGRDDAASDAPLPDGVASDGCGLGIIVAVTKSDMLPSVQRDHGITDEMLDVVQHALREISLRHGAALVFTSAKEQTNTQLLLSYLKHRLYGYRFSVSSQLSEHASVFVPAGWDAKQWLDALLAGNPLANQPFESAVPPPKQAAHTFDASAEAKVIAVDEQTFLKQQAELLDATGGNVGGVMSQGASKDVRSYLDGLLDQSADGARSPDQASEKRTGDASRRTSRTVAAGADAAADGAAGGGKKTDDALASFFSNLINKNAKGAASTRKDVAKDS